MMFPPLNSKINAMSPLCPYPYVTDLDASTEALSSHNTTKCMTSSCTLLDEPSPLTVCAAKPSSIRDTEDQRRRHIRVGEYCRQELTLSSESYGKLRLTPSSTSYLEMLAQIRKVMIQWISSWIVGRSIIRISTVITAMIN